MCVSAANLLPYGTEHGDTRADQALAVNVTLPESFSFMGEIFSTVHVRETTVLVDHMQILQMLHLLFFWLSVNCANQSLARSIIKSLSASFIAR